MAGRTLDIDSTIDRLARTRLRLCFWVSVILSTLLVSFSTTHAADAVPGEQWCDRDIDQISFSGNKTTRAHVMRRELVQQQAAICSLDDVIDGIQNIMDLGLFRSVRAELRLDGDKLELVYLVTEKIFFLPIPRLSRTSDGELRLGAQLRWDNFLGRLHQLKITSEKRQEDDGRGRTGYVHKLSYTVPRFFGSQYGLGLNVSGERRNTQLEQDDVIFGEALQQSERFEWRLARWANQSTGISGLSYFGGVAFERRNYEIRSGESGPFIEGDDVALVAGAEIQRVHQESYRRTGHHYSASLRLADKFLGADFRYRRVDLRMIWYLPLRRPQTNLNIQLRLGWSDLAPFGQRSYEIGGGELIRGMRSDDQTGNILTVLNVEYLSGFFAYPAWRWVAFTDIGNVYRDNNVNLLTQNIRAGVGLRWKLVALTNTDIRLDIAWDPDRQKVTPYISTSLTY